MILLVILALIGLGTVAKIVFFNLIPRYCWTDAEKATAKAEADQLRKWVKTELGKLQDRINQESKKPPELRKMDEGVVAANPILQEADDETLAAYGMYRKEDGIYIVKVPLDPRNKVLAMSDDEVTAAFFDITRANDL